MILKRICWLHSRISPKQAILIKVEDWDFLIDKTDIIKADDDCLTVFRANGKILVINPSHIKFIKTYDKGGF